MQVVDDEVPEPRGCRICCAECDEKFMSTLNLIMRSGRHGKAGWQVNITLGSSPHHSPKLSH